jgi:uracil-DNA glycosylase
MPVAKPDDFSFQRGRDDCRTAFVLSAPGRRERQAGYPAAGQTGVTLDRLLQHLHEADGVRFPFLSRREYRIVNALAKELYKAKHKRTEGYVSEVTEKANLARLHEELAGIDCIVALGVKAQLGLEAARITPLLCGPHPSLQRLNTLYKVSEPTSEAARDERIRLFAQDVLAGCPDGSSA